MKTYEEMAKQVLKRSEEEIENRNIRRRKMTRIVSSLSCFCMVAVIGFVVYQNGLLDFGKSTDLVETHDIKVENGTTTGVTDEENYMYSMQTSAKEETENAKASKESAPVEVVKPEAASGGGGAYADASTPVAPVEEDKAVNEERRTGITAEQAVANARAMLGDKEIETITNLDNPKIENVVYEENPPFYLFDKNAYIAGNSLFRITYNTELDGLLGPITFYVDAVSGVVVGADYRE